MKNSQYLTVPNLFTTLNLFCGFLAVHNTINKDYTSAAWLIFIASVLDALDGRIARKVNKSSDFGLQMDSLSDVISFGIAPSILVYEYYLKELGNGIIGLMVAFMPLLFAAFRLARFNVLSSKGGKKNYFFGLPAPMSAVAIASTILLHAQLEWNILLRFLIGLVPFVSILMASTLKYEGFPKFNLRERGANRLKLLIFSATLILMFVLPEYTLFIFMMLYLLSGPFKVVYALLRNEDTDLDLLATESGDLHQERLS